MKPNEQEIEFEERKEKKMAEVKNVSTCTRQAEHLANWLAFLEMMKKDSDTGL
jgi:hypothetical protein